ncbi:unnamed protein product [Caenorhabditis angaria]|uniref:Uncharacterized protein n=1 Tax=Caenorhabditis angaria TaxID=860376 RepID=A0A9P1I573_9PELO|nr:unnamed protein product [Caenorhabditis angaria]
MPFQDFRCGSGAFSTTISYTSSLLCDQIQMNQCCMLHDQCYSSCSVPQTACDTDFCNCLSSIVTNPLYYLEIFFICPLMG